MRGVERSMHTVNVGVIGAGRIGQIHARNLKYQISGAKLVAVLAVMGGAILAKPSVRRTVILAGMLVVSYSIVQPIVSLGHQAV